MVVQERNLRKNACTDTWIDRDIKKNEKNRKKCLTIENRRGNISKLSDSGQRTSELSPE